MAGMAVALCRLPGSMISGFCTVNRSLVQPPRAAASTAAKIARRLEEPVRVTSMAWMRIAQCSLEAHVEAEEERPDRWLRQEVLGREARLGDAVQLGVDAAVLGDRRQIP